MGSSNNRPHLPPMAANAWAPGFTFRIGWSQSGRAEKHHKNEKNLPTANPFDTFRDFFSRFVNHLTSPSLWASKSSSYTYLIGKGEDGKEKLVFVTDTSTTSTSTEVDSKSVVTTHKPKPAKVAEHTNKQAVQKVRDYHVYAAPYWMGTAYVSTSADEISGHRDAKVGGTRAAGDWWDMSPAGDASPRWVLFTLFTIFLVIFLWIGGSTLFLSRQLNRDEV